MDPTAHSPRQPSLVDSALSRGAGPGDLQSSHPASPFHENEAGWLSNAKSSALLC